MQQIIASNNLQGEGLVVLSNNVFWIYGKRFFQFDTFNVDLDDDDEGGGPQASGGQANDLRIPSQAMMNDYLLNVFVVKKFEVRMYDLEKGQLQAMHTNIFQEEQMTAEITKFKIDKRHRKAYVANNQGKIIVINCQNGVVMKNVTQYIEDRKNIH